MKAKIILSGFVLVVMATVALIGGQRSDVRGQKAGVIHANFQIEKSPWQDATTTKDFSRITKTGEWHAAFSPLPDPSGSHQTQGRMPKRIFKTGIEDDSAAEQVIREIQEK